MKKPIGLTIDWNAKFEPVRYRFNVEFEDGSSHGSCFCYDSFDEAFLRAIEVLESENNLK